MQPLFSKEVPLTKKAFWVAIGCMMFGASSNVMEYSGANAWMGTTDEILSLWARVWGL